MEKPVDIIFQHNTDGMVKIKAVSIAGKSLMTSNRMSDASEDADELYADKWEKFCIRRGLVVRNVYNQCSIHDLKV